MSVSGNEATLLCPPCQFNSVFTIISSMDGSHNISSIDGSHNISSIDGSHNISSIDGSHNISSIDRSHNISSIDGSHNISRSTVFTIFLDRRFSQYFSIDGSHNISRSMVLTKISRSTVLTRFLDRVRVNGNRYWWDWCFWSFLLTSPRATVQNKTCL